MPAICTRPVSFAVILWSLCGWTPEPLSAAGPRPLAARSIRPMPVVRVHRAYRPWPTVTRYAPIPAAQEPVRFWVASSLSCPQSARLLRGECSPNLYAVGMSGRSTRVRREELCAALNPGVPVCIFVHGSFVWSPDFEVENLAVERWLGSVAQGRPLYLIFYRWPSDTGLVVVPQVNVAVLGMRAEWNGYYLARLIADIPDTNPVCVIGHSHGARVAAAALHLLGGGTVQGMTLTADVDCSNRLRSVFLAAAVDHYWLNPGQRYGRTLHVCERLLNVISRDDLVLTVYPWREAFGAPALGHVGLLPADRTMLGPQSARVRQIDVTPLVGSGHLMPYYRNNAAIARAISGSVYFADNVDFSQRAGGRLSPPVQPVGSSPVFKRSSQ